MKIILFILLFIIYYHKSSSITSINEFEEIEIINDPQILLYNNYFIEELDYFPEIIINCLNPKFKKGIAPTLIIIKTSKKNFELSSDKSIVISRDDYINEGKGEYKLIFKNYIGGKILVFNSIHPFPLKSFEKLTYFWSKSSFNSNFIISMYSDILVEDTYLTIKGQIENLSIEKISENQKEKIYFDTNITKLYKGYSYNLTYNTDNSLFLFLSKRQIKNYNKTDYNRYYFLPNEPIYYSINLSEFNNSIKELYFFALKNFEWVFSVDMEIAEIDENFKEEELIKEHLLHLMILLLNQNKY